MERLTPGWDVERLAPTVKSLVLTIVSCNVCDFFKKKKNLFKILKVLLFLLPQPLERLFEWDLVHSLSLLQMGM